MMKMIWWHNNDDNGDDDDDTNGDDKSYGVCVPDDRDWELQATPSDPLPQLLMSYFDEKERKTNLLRIRLMSTIDRHGDDYLNGGGWIVQIAIWTMPIWIRIF